MFVHCGSQKYHEPKIYDFDMSILEDSMAPVIFSPLLASIKNLVVIILLSIWELIQIFCDLENTLL